MTNSQPTIEIAPPHVKTSYNCMHIIYLSHSMGSQLYGKLHFSISIHHRTPSMPHVHLVSNSVEPNFSTSLQSTYLDESYVNHVSCSDGRGHHAHIYP
jgi:hypothetical protein